MSMVLLRDWQTLNRRGRPFSYVRPDKKRVRAKARGERWRPRLTATVNVKGVLGGTMVRKVEQGCVTDDWRAVSATVTQGRG